LIKTQQRHKQDKNKTKNQPLPLFPSNNFGIAALNFSTGRKTPPEFFAGHKNL
jgi:hypothetical protein